MKDYVEEALSAGYICPSISAGYFFEEKKDGGLQPCIDYRGLNAMTVCYPYPLPLVPANAVPHDQGPLCILSNALRTYKCSSCLPVYDQ